MAEYGVHFCTGEGCWVLAVAIGSDGNFLASAAGQDVPCSGAMPLAGWRSNCWWDLVWLQLCLFEAEENSTFPPINLGAGFFSFLQKANFSPPQFLQGLNRTDMQTALSWSLCAAVVFASMCHISFWKSSLPLLSASSHKGRFWECLQQW